MFVRNNTSINNSLSSGFTGSYRFGFNGQEKDDEIYGAGNAYTATFWEYDPRLGRRWNLDPKPQISISDYACFMNNPIWFSDPLGNFAGDYFKTDGTYLGSDGIDDKKIYTVNNTTANSLTQKECLGIKNVVDGGTTGSRVADVTIRTNVKLSSLNRDDLIKRSIWIYGEGGSTPGKNGENLPDYYAWAIENARNATGNHNGKFFIDEEDMMTKKMNVGGESKYNDFMNGTLPGAYVGYTPKTETVSTLFARKDTGPIFRKIMASIIQANIGTSTDPTNGSWGWGTDSSPSKINGSTTRANVQDVNNTWHNFGQR
jgi:RHS repeat-associated protein